MHSERKGCRLGGISDLVAGPAGTSTSNSLSKATPGALLKSLSKVSEASPNETAGMTDATLNLILLSWTVLDKANVITADLGVHASMDGVRGFCKSSIRLRFIIRVQTESCWLVVVVKRERRKIWW